MKPREIRLAAGLSIERAAVYAGVTSPTIRLYEANQNAPGIATCARLAAYYAKLAADLESAPEPSPSAA